MHHVNHILTKYKQAEVSANDFTLGEDKAIYEIVEKQANPPYPETDMVVQIPNDLDPILAHKVNTLVTRAFDAELGPDHLPERLAKDVLDMRYEKIREHLNFLKHLANYEKRNGSGDAPQLQVQQTKVLVPFMRSINVAKDNMSASGSRV